MGHRWRRGFKKATNVAILVGIMFFIGPVAHRRIVRSWKSPRSILRHLMVVTVAFRSGSKLIFSLTARHRWRRGFKKATNVAILAGIMFFIGPAAHRRIVRSWKSPRSRLRHLMVVTVAFRSEGIAIITPEVPHGMFVSNARFL